MPAPLLGTDVRVWIESATAGTFNMIKGNTTLRRTRNGSTFSTGSKDDFPYDPQAAGTRTLSIAAEFVPQYPDTNGMGRLETLANGATPAPFKIQLRKGGASGASPADVLFEGSVYCTDLNDQQDNNNPQSISCTFVIASAPTTDKLGG